MRVSENRLRKRRRWKCWTQSDWKESYKSCLKINKNGVYFYILFFIFCQEYIIVLQQFRHLPINFIHHFLCILIPSNHLLFPILFPILIFPLLFILLLLPILTVIPEPILPCILFLRRYFMLLYDIHWTVPFFILVLDLSLLKLPIYLPCRQLEQLPVFLYILYFRSLISPIPLIHPFLGVSELFLKDLTRSTIHY